MSTKKRSYAQLLKEAIQGQGVDTSDTVDVKGPMLDAIISYRGGGELPTHKDAASILERYYFGEDEDKGVTVVGDADPIDNTIDEVPAAVDKTKKDIEKEITKEADEEDEVEDEKDEEITETEKLENAIIEKLIEEMEEELDEDASMDPDPDNEPAGMKKGDPEKIVPNRKDITGEAEEITADDAEDEDEELDVDDKVKKEFEELYNLEDSPGAGAQHGHTYGAPLGMDKDEDGDEVEEAFAIFKEQILDEEDEEDEVPEVDSDDVTV